MEPADIIVCDVARPKGGFACDGSFEFNNVGLFYEEHNILSLKMTPYSLKLIKAISCYK